MTPENFKLVSGGDALEDYQFNRKTIHHLRRPDCGIESFARGTNRKGKEMIAINIRCLDGVEIGALKLTPINGAIYERAGQAARLSSASSR